ncbi:MAG: hypothetical protein O6941_04275, partial [Planctomycetota bacterium]|nr:hypothetical protein [Planctomycetota bacterium]MCZ6611829.1 hypothetical protein [Planctomycetota bacterium]
ADAPRGSNGFGYDPLMYLPDAGCTSAQLTPEQKNARSHRGEAARKMAKQIDRLPSVGQLSIPQNSKSQARPDPS